MLSLSISRQNLHPVSNGGAFDRLLAPTGSLAMVFLTSERSWQKVGSHFRDALQSPISTSRGLGLENQRFESIRGLEYHPLRSEEQ